MPLGWINIIKGLEYSLTLLSKDGDPFFSIKLVTVSECTYGCTRIKTTTGMVFLFYCLRAALYIYLHIYCISYNIYESGLRFVNIPKYSDDQISSSSEPTHGGPPTSHTIPSSLPSNKGTPEISFRRMDPWPMRLMFLSCLIV